MWWHISPRHRESSFHSGVSCRINLVWLPCPDPYLPQKEDPSDLSGGYNHRWDRPDNWVVECTGVWWQTQQVRAAPTGTVILWHSIALLNLGPRICSSSRIVLNDFYNHIRLKGYQTKITPTKATHLRTFSSRNSVYLYNRVLTSIYVCLFIYIHNNKSIYVYVYVYMYVYICVVNRTNLGTDPTLWTRVEKYIETISIHVMY